MDILLIEDKTEKLESIKKFLYERLEINECNITEAKNLRDSSREIIKTPFDLIIFDMYLPINKGDNKTQDISEDIIEEFTQSKYNYKTETILITTYDSPENISLFNEKGVSVVNYNNDKKWQESLDLKIDRIKNKIQYDFLIFCALDKERSAYHETEANFGALKIFNGIDCQCIEIEGINGLCIIPGRMGLVNMAITASKAIELFQPKFVTMSGICAGVEENSKLLDIIVGEVCWEYQTGKFKDNEFKCEPYQAAINNDIKTEISQYISISDNLLKIKEQLFETELKYSSIYLAPISSGSAVIANAEKMLEIGSQHRKMAGLEMEMYALYEAAQQSQCKPSFFGAKAVVDLGNSSKGDDLQDTASIISARFVVNFLATKLKKKN